MYNTNSIVQDIGDSMYIIIAFIVIFVIVLLFTLTARNRMIKTYQKYIRIPNTKGIDGKTLAFYLRHELGLEDLQFARTDHKLADAYYIKQKVLVLSNAVADEKSLASLTIVAHEFGHALQHKTNQTKFNCNYILLKITRFTNCFILPLFFLGLLLYATNWHTLGGLICLYIALALFLCNITLKISNIPVEYDASKRGLALLTEYQILSPKEYKNAKKLLNTAAQTYIAGLFDGIFIFTSTIRNLLQL